MSKCSKRYEQWKDNSFDQIIMAIKKGSIKCGRYSNLVKIDEKVNLMKQKEFFTNDKNKD